MNTNEYLVHFVSAINKMYEDAVNGLTDQQLYNVAYPKGNHIAWETWHYIRTQDNIVNFIFQNRKPTVWLRQELDKKWNLPRVAQGTGMTIEEAHALRIPSVDAIVQYIRDVNADVILYLATISHDDLQVVNKVTPWGDATRYQHIGQTIIAHGYGHLGHIFTKRSLQGLSGDSF